MQAGGFLPKLTGWAGRSVEDGSEVVTAQLTHDRGGRHLPLILGRGRAVVRTPDQVVRVYVQFRGEQVEQADAVEFDVPAFHLGHPALCLAQGGSEVGLRHAEAEPCATADLFGFFQHQRAP